MMDNLPFTAAHWLKCNYWLYGNEKRLGVMNLKTRTLYFVMILNYLNKHQNENHSISLIYLEEISALQNSFLNFVHTVFEINNNFSKFIKNFHFILKYDDSPLLCIHMFNSSGYKIFSTSFCSLAFPSQANVILRQKTRMVLVYLGRLTWYGLKKQ